MYIQSVPKVFSVWAKEVTKIWTPDRKVELEYIVEQILRWIDPFRYKTDLEVQERAVGFHQIFLKVQQDIHEIQIPEPRSYQDEATQGWENSRPQNLFPCLSDLASLFSDTELNPVSTKAQRKVPIPDGLDLQTSLFTSREYISWPNDTLEEEDVPKPRVASSSIPSTRTRQDHLDRVRDDPFYILGDNNLRPGTTPSVSGGEEDFDSIPIVQFDGGTNLLTPAKTKVRKKKLKAREIVLDEPVDIAGDEMPENAASSDTEVNGRKGGKMQQKGKNVLRNKEVRGLEDIDFEEEERLEREAIEAERVARLSGAQKPVEVAEVVEEPLVVERVKKKKVKKKDGTGEGSKAVKKKKEKAVA
jgi:AP-3 complex subunit delta-1